MLDRLIGL